MRSPYHSHPYCFGPGVTGIRPVSSRLSYAMMRKDADALLEIHPIITTLSHNQYKAIDIPCPTLAILKAPRTCRIASDMRASVPDDASCSYAAPVVRPSHTWAAGSSYRCAGHRLIAFRVQPWVARQWLAKLPSCFLSQGHGEINSLRRATTSRQTPCGCFTPRPRKFFFCSRRRHVLCGKLFDAMLQAHSCD